MRWQRRHKCTLIFFLWVLLFTYLWTKASLPAGHLTYSLSRCIDVLKNIVASWCFKVHLYILYLLTRYSEELLSYKRYWLLLVRCSFLLCWMQSVSCHWMREIRLPLHLLAACPLQLLSIMSRHDMTLYFMWISLFVPQKTDPLQVTINFLTLIGLSGQSQAKKGERRGSGFQL